MSLSLTKTKRRINSVESTKKITKAMELIATVKLKRFKTTMLNNVSYCEMIFRVVHELYKYNRDIPLSNYSLENNSKSDLYVVITSNLGLCAGYNNNIYKFVEASTNKENDFLMVIGNRGNSHYKNADYKLLDAPAYFENGITDENAVKFCNYLLKIYLTNNYRSIKLIYTHYVNSLSFVPSVFSILPFSIEMATEDDPYKGFPPIFEPNINEIMNEIVPIYITSLVYQKLLESQVSEQASRRTAMDSANDNADDILSTLKREYNKARQGAITREITEVVSAANAQE